MKRLNVWTICLIVLLFVLSLYGIYENHYHFNGPGNCIESATNFYADVAIFFVGFAALVSAFVGAIFSRKHKGGLLKFVLYAVVVLSILIAVTNFINYAHGC